MGIFSSKIDVEAIEAIETDVVDLIIRLNEEEGQLDSFIKKCLLRAIRAYTNKIENEDNGYVSIHKICRMKDLIGRVTCKLNEFPTTEKSQLETFYTVGKQPQEIKNHLFQIDRIVKTKNFCQTEIDDLLKTVSGYFSYITNTENGLKRDEIDRICILILKLFLKSSVTNISKILDKSLNDFNRIVEVWGNFRAHNFDSSNAKCIKRKLTGIASNINTLTVISEGALGEIDKHLSVTQDTFMSSPSITYNQESNIFDLNLLKKVKKELDECGNVLEKFSPPIGDGVIIRLRNKVNNLIFIDLDNLFFYSGEVLIERQYLHEQAAQILDKLETIDNKNKEISANLKFLKTVEEKIAVDIGSNKSFSHKKNSLELLKESVNEIDASNNELYLQKVEITNRLTGYIIIESANYLRQMKKTLDTYRVYSREFPFSYGSDFFHNKVREIYSLKEHINDLPKRNHYINQRASVIEEHLTEVLVTLETKAKHNQRVISHIKDLENEEILTTEIGKTNDSHSINKLNRLNAVRQKINFIDNFHNRIIMKKVKISSKIQEIEETIYDSKFSKLLKDIKSILNEYETRAETFIDVYGSEIYRTTKKEISVLLNNVHTYEDSTKPKYKQILINTINIILDVLKKTSKENERRSTIKQRLEDIEKNISSHRGKEFLKSQRELLNSIKVEENCEELLNLERKINIEEARLKLLDLNKRRQQLQMKIFVPRPLNVELFEELLSDLLLMKDAVDDMPEGDVHLDSEKQQLSKEIYKMLVILDEHFRSSMDQKPSENIVDLQSRFNNLGLDNLNMSKSSVDFVRTIRRKAESFEEYAKYYMGSSYSVDYYVIHENLLRLLEELDTVECNGDDLIKETVEAMNYIKDLLEVLSSSGL